MPQEVFRRDDVLDNLCCDDDVEFTLERKWERSIVLKYEIVLLWLDVDPNHIPTAGS
jgi:hypothetical protein